MNKNMIASELLVMAKELLARIPKGDFALVKSSGMDDHVLSVHKTQEEAEKAMQKLGGEPDSMMKKGMRVVDVSQKGGNEVIEVFGKMTIRPRAAGQLVIAKQKYKDYTIDKSGDNFYVTDPSGHRAFGEVPASIETAKKWIDQDIREKGKKASIEMTAMEFPTQDALDKYLKDHPDANRSNHKVVKTEDHPFLQYQQRKNDKKLQEIAKHYKKDPKDLTNDEIEEFNKPKKSKKTNWQEAPFSDYMDEVESKVKTTQAQMDYIGDCQDQGVTPEECVKSIKDGSWKQSL